jgi:hypothetical protein
MVVMMVMMVMMVMLMMVVMVVMTIMMMVMMMVSVVIKILMVVTNILFQFLVYSSLSPFPLSQVPSRLAGGSEHEVTMKKSLSRQSRNT